MCKGEPDKRKKHSHRYEKKKKKKEQRCPGSEQVAEDTDNGKGVL